MSNNWTVYEHISNTTNKCYIGITSQEPTDRWKNGFGYTKGTHFRNAIDKYGWNNFGHIILATNLTEEKAKQLEQTLIVVMDSYNNGYNSTFGGDGCKGIIISDEAKQKMSQAHLGVPLSIEHRKAISIGGKKRPINKEALQKLIDYNKTHTNMHKGTINKKVPICELDKYLSMGYVKGWYLSEEAKKKKAEKFKGKHLSEKTKQKISNANKGRKLSEEAKQKMSKAKKGKRNLHCLKRIAQYTVDGELINTYKSATDLEMENKEYNHKCISKCCLGYSKTYKGYVWRYIDE